MRVAIATDTNSGITAEEGRRLGVYVISMPVLIDGNTCYEGEDLTEADLYRYMREGRRVATSQPSPGDILELWDRVLETYDALVYVPMSSGLSASCQTAQALAADYDGRVQVADTHRISVPQRLAVLDGLAMAEAGCTAEEIRLELERTGMDAMIYIGVETLQYLRRGGRVTAAAAAMSDLLQIKPLLKIEGEKLDAFAKVRGVKACKQRLIEAMRQTIAGFRGKGWTISVCAAGSFSTPEEESAWFFQVREAFPEEEIRCAPLALSIGCHTGPGAFGMAAVRHADIPGK